MKPKKSICKCCLEDAKLLYMEIREALVQHETEIQKYFYKSPRAKSASRRIKFFQNLRHDGDLLAYVQVAEKDEKSALGDQDLSQLTYASLLDIVKEYLSALNVDDCLNVQTIKAGDKYSHEEICALTGKYNFMQGMSIRYQDNEPIYAVVH